MSASTTAVTSSRSTYATGPFWERLWRLSGINFIACVIVGSAISGQQPSIGASAYDLVSFYDGDRARILIAAAIFGLAALNLMWFAAAIRSVLADAEQDGWGAAATASSAAMAGFLIFVVTIVTSLAYSIAGSGNDALTSGLNDLSWAALVMTSFPRAMLIMAGTFGFWRAGFISNRGFAAGVGAVILVLLGGTTWLSDGLWSPDGAYTRFISPAIGVVWFLAATKVLLSRSNTRASW